MAFKAIGFDYNGVIDLGMGADEQMLKLVDRLRLKGYKTAILSNFGVASAKRLREIGVLAHFDSAHFSGETGHSKPQTEAFLNLAEDLGVQIGELLFIDDSPYSLSTFEKTGYSPILFTDYDRLISELSELSII